MIRLKRLAREKMPQLLKEDLVRLAAPFGRGSSTAMNLHWVDKIGGWFVIV